MRAILTGYHEHYLWVLVPRRVKHLWLGDERLFAKSSILYARKLMLCFWSAEAKTPSAHLKVCNLIDAANTCDGCCLANIAC